MNREWENRRSETMDDYEADSAWANDGGNLHAGDPALPAFESPPTAPDRQPPVTPSAGS